MYSLLSTLQKRLKVNRNLAAALLTGYGLMGITIVIQLLLVPLYLIHLGKEKFGILAIIMSANSYASILLAWLSGSMARIFAEKASVNDSAGFREAYTFAKVAYVSYALIAIALFWLAAPLLMPCALADMEVRIAVALSCVYFLFAYEYSCDRQAFNARHMQARGNINEATGQIVFAVGVVVALYTNMGLPGVVSAQIAGMLCNRVLAWKIWRADSYKLGWQRRISGWRKLWSRVSGRVGRDYVIYGALVLTLQADLLLIGWLLGPEVAATFYLLWRIPEVFIQLLWRIPSTLAPSFIMMDTRNERVTLQRYYRKGLIVMIILAGLAALVYGLAGPWIVGMWVSEHAIDGQIPYVIAGAALFFIAVSKWPAELAYSLMNTRRLVIVAAIETIAKMLLFWGLFSSFDYLSPLIAIVLVHVCLVWWLYLRLGQSTMKNEFR